MDIATLNRMSMGETIKTHRVWSAQSTFISYSYFSLLEWIKAKAGKNNGNEQRLTYISCIIFCWLSSSMHYHTCRAQYKHSQMNAHMCLHFHVNADKHRDTHNTETESDRYSFAQNCKHTHAHARAHTHTHTYTQKKKKIKIRANAKTTHICHTTTRQ